VEGENTSEISVLLLLTGMTNVIFFICICVSTESSFFDKSSSLSQF
jgi:hypothetical protein